MAARLLILFGVLFGTSGAAAGTVLIVVRRAAYEAAVSQRRGMFAPLLWQLSLGSGILIIVLSLLFGAIFVLLGRMWARLARLERADGVAGPSPSGIADANGGAA